jgi:hypothetical protein
LPEQRARLGLRQGFAQDMERRVRDINSDEQWTDRRYAELEAHVEADEERRAFSLNPLRWRASRGLRRERSLTKAIKSSRSQVIQLVGEPGSGKSVSLRYVAQTTAARAARARSLKAVIPLYLNLKELRRAPNAAVDSDLIKAFVIKTLKKGNRMGVENFLKEEFESGLLEGTWLFLFDSFDEIPEVLSSTEVDEVIKGYAGAIYDFLGGLNRCRGVIASRHFRGPSRSSWPRYTILPLSESRRLRFIKGANLRPAVSQQLREHLALGDYDLRDLSSNPMLLGVLCNHMEKGNPFPDSVHALFADYLARRFDDAAKLVKSHFKENFGVEVEIADVRAAAESAAFCMAADKGIGLSPARAELKRSMLNHGFDFGAETDTLLDALVFIKLGRTEELPSGGHSFTFVHRRFQEYFATCVVLREPWRVGPRELLTDARWRETAVVICQTQPPAALGTLVEGARAELSRFVEEFPGGVRPEELSAAAADEDDDAAKREPTPPEDFEWPHGLLHVLSLLQDGFRRRLNELPDDVRGLAGAMLLTVKRRAGRIEQKAALETAGAATPRVLLRLIRDAFRGDSQLLKNVAYRQVARLPEVPDDIADSIRSALIGLVRTGRLGRERLATKAHLARLDKPQRFVSSLRLLLALPTADLLLHALVLAAWASYMRVTGPLPADSDASWTQLTAVLLSALLVSHLSFRLLRLTRAMFGDGLDLMFIIYARGGGTAVALFMPVIYGDTAGETPGLTFLWPYEMVCAYAFVWLPSALLAARVGQCTSPVWWPFMPLVPLTLFAANLRSITKWTMKNLLGIVIMMAVIVLSGGAVSYYFENRGGNDIVVPAVMVLPVLLLAAVATYKWLCDKTRWHMRSGSYRPPMSAESFREEFDNYRTKSYRMRFVRLVHTRRALEATRRADEVVGELSLSLERDLVELRRAQPFQNFKKTLKRPGGMPDSELLDELTQLLEQVRDGRHDRAPQTTAPPSTAPARATAVEAERALP